MFCYTTCSGESKRQPLVTNCILNPMHFVFAKTLQDNFYEIHEERPTPITYDAAYANIFNQTFFQETIIPVHVYLYVFFSRTHTRGLGECISSKITPCCFNSELDIQMNEAYLSYTLYDFSNVQQNKMSYGNTILDFTYTYDLFVTKCDLPAGSSDPVAPFCDVSEGTSQETCFREAFDEDYVTWNNRRKHARVGNNCTYIIPDCTNVYKTM